MTLPHGAGPQEKVGSADGSGEREELSLVTCIFAFPCVFVDRKSS